MNKSTIPPETLLYLVIIGLLFTFLIFCILQIIKNAQFKKKAQNECKENKTTPVPTPNSVNKTVQKKHKSNSTIKIIASCILLFFDFGFLLNLHTYNQYGRFFAVMFVLISAILIIGWIYSSYKMSEIKEILKALYNKQTISALKKENEKLKTLLSPELQNASNMMEMETKLQENIDGIQSLISQKESELQAIDDKIKQKNSQLIIMDDEILVQEFGLYKPTYDFASALDYKEKLASLRQEQKTLIREKSAVSGVATGWIVNGNKSQGKKMVSDTQKLLLRAFNTECDDIISKVKYTNFDSSLERIYRSADTISRLGTVMNISITSKYLDLKIKELRLAFEYQQKKQQEKEDAKAARIEQREQAKVQKELEEQQRKIEKEQVHYQTAYEKILTQISSNPTNEDLLLKKNELENKLSDIDRALADIDYRQANMRAGYVYIISNIGAFGENIYKIGMTRRLDPQERVDELGDASVPFKFDVHAMIFSDDAPALEAALHRAFEDRKLNMVNQRREFFNVTLDEIKEVVRKNFDKTVEFVDVPDAEQFRISQKLRQSM